MVDQICAEFVEKLMQDPAHSKHILEHTRGKSRSGNYRSYDFEIQKHTGSSLKTSNNDSGGHEPWRYHEFGNFNFWRCCNNFPIHGEVKNGSILNRLVGKGN